MPKINSSKELARFIDHSILKPTVTEPEIMAEIETGVIYNTASICVMPQYLSIVSDKVRGTQVAPSTVCGFPLGHDEYVSKLFSVRHMIHNGATEIDYVININNVLSGKWNYVENEIKSVVYDVHERKAKLKVIFENCYLNDEMKVTLTKICSQYEVDWVKTSTGFGTSGATIHDVILMKENCSGITQVKAAGGVRTLDVMLEFIEAGITRCGCTTTKKVLDEAKERYGS